MLSATEPWQTLPPAHGSVYSRFDIVGSRSAGASPEEKSAEEVFPPDSDEATTLQVFLDKQTGLPFMLRWVSSSGAPLDQTYWTYERARKTASDYPADFLVAPQPSNQSGMRTETRVKGSGAMGPVTDDETQSSFRPWYLGSAIDLAGIGPMCLRQNITVTHGRMQTVGETDTPDGASDPDVEPALRSAAIETLAQASYVLAPGLAKCSDGDFLGTGDAWSLDIVTMNRDSSNARTWRSAFEQDARASEVAVDDPDALSQGLQPFTFGGASGTAFVVPSREGSSALVEVGATTIIVTGPFTKSSLQSVLDRFRSQ